MTLKLVQHAACAATNRRRFLAGAASMAGGVMLGSSFAGHASAQPSKGGRLRMGNNAASTTDSLDPATWESSFMQVTGYMSANNLTEVAVNGQLVPELAESFESDDAARWVFRLRRGVEFHNGKTLTPEDVIASFQHHMGDDSASAAKGLLIAVQSISKDGDMNVVFQLDSPNADFPFIVSDYHLVIRPSSGDAIDMASGIGTGGYVTETFDPGVRVFGTRNPNYFKEGAAHFDEVELIAINDTVARQNALMNGDVDHINNVDLRTISLLQRAANLEIVETTGFAHHTFPMRVDAAPFDNYDIRMALKYAVKRQELVDKILVGHGAVGNDHPISVAHRYHNSELEQREFDADKAAFHYKKSGHSGTIQLSASDTAFTGAVDAAQLIAASAAEAGIEIEVVREPQDGYWSNVWNKKPWCASTWGGRPTEDWMFAAAYTADTAWNETAWRTGEAADRFNSAVVAARSELDDNKRRQLYYEAQSLIHEDGGAIVPIFTNLVSANTTALAHGDKVAGNWENDGAKLPERWWFA